MKKFSGCLLLAVICLAFVTPAFATITVSGELGLQANYTYQETRAGVEGRNDYSIAPTTKDCEFEFDFEYEDVTASLTFKLGNFSKESITNEFNARYRDPTGTFGAGLKISASVTGVIQKLKTQSISDTKVSSSAWYQINDTVRMGLGETDRIVASYENRGISVGDAGAKKAADALSFEFAYPESTLSVSLFMGELTKVQSKLEQETVRLSPAATLNMFETDTAFDETFLPVTQVGYEFSAGPFDFYPAVHYAKYEFDKQYFETNPDTVSRDGWQTEVEEWVVSLPMQTKFWIFNMQGEITHGQNLGTGNIVTHKGLEGTAYWIEDIYDNTVTDPLTGEYISGVSDYPFKVLPADTLCGWISANLGKWTLSYGRARVNITGKINRISGNKEQTWGTAHRWNWGLAYSWQPNDMMTVTPQYTYLSRLWNDYRNAIGGYDKQTGQQALAQHQFQCRIAIDF
jgi:hypothetical protein